MSIKGAIQSKEINDYGFARIKVSGTWYGGDKKGDISSEIHSGDIVEFEAYEKEGKNGKFYSSFKSQSLKKVSAAKAGAPVDKGPVASKDEYWATKEARDIAKDPQIAYQGSYDRALTFADLALRNGAFDALAKAKPTARLEVLQAFVEEQAVRIMGLVYAAQVPAKTAQPTSAVDASEETEEEVEDETSWS